MPVAAGTMEREVVAEYTQEHRSETQRADCRRNLFWVVQQVTKLCSLKRLMTHRGTSLFATVAGNSFRAARILRFVLGAPSDEPVWWNLFWVVTS